MNYLALSGVTDALRRTSVAVRTRLSRTLRSIKYLLLDRSARPVLMYLLAMALAGGSIGHFLLSGGGTIGDSEMMALLGSIGVVLVMSMSLAGNAPRRD